MNNTVRILLLLCGIALALSASACSRDEPTGPGARAILVRVGGEGLTGAGLSRLGVPLVVRALRDGTAEPDVPVRFTIQRGASSGAVLSNARTTTDIDGVASTELTLGDGADTVTVSASAPSGATELFIIAVTPAAEVRTVSPPAFAGGDTVTLLGSGLSIAASGAVQFGSERVTPFETSDTAVRVVAPACAAPGLMDVFVSNAGARSRAATAHYSVTETALTLAPLEGTSARATDIDDCIVLGGAGAKYLLVPHYGVSATTAQALDVEIGAGSPTPAFTPAAPSQQRIQMNARFERALRAREAALAAAGPPPPAAPRRAAATVPAEGAERTFRVIADIDATSFANVRARLAFRGANVAIWVDTLAPDEFPHTTLAPLARLLDEELYALDVSAFGEPSDVDNDGRVHLVLSPIVNSLTPAGFCSASGFVAAFFSAHDLYPGGANANDGEVFYGFVPDTAATYGCPHDVDEFRRVLPVAFVHELQHAINYNQHVLRRGGVEEEVWLNEGLSHAAEELASKYYEAKYPWPSGRGSPDQLFPDSSSSFILFNLINAYLFLRQPFASSLTSFQGAGTIEERGGAWLFVRWLADLHGEGIMRELVQSPLRGAANVEARTRVPFAQTVDDFAIAVFTDSLPGVPREAVPGRWRFQSRNWRVIFQRLNTIANFPPFPIEPLVLTQGESVRGTLRAGGFVYLTVDVPVEAPAVTLRFRPADGSQWLPGDAPRVSIFRLQ